MIDYYIYVPLDNIGAVSVREDVGAGLPALE